MSIQKNYEEIIQSLPANVKLVAVSKTHPAEAIQEVYNLGQRVLEKIKFRKWSPNSLYSRMISNGI